MNSVLAADLVRIAKKLRKESFKKDFVAELWDGTKVFLVNGDEVRNSGLTSFYGGAHPKYEDCPTKGEIWIERLPAGGTEEAKILVHEVVEYLVMKHCGKNYNTAHDIANSVEGVIRALEGQKSSKKASLKVTAQQEESKFEKYFDRRPLEEQEEEMDPALYNFLKHHRERTKKIVEEAESRKDQDDARLKSLVKGCQRGLANIIEATKEIADIYERRLRVINNSIPDLTDDALHQFLNDPKVHEELQEYLAPIHAMQATLEQEFRETLKSLVGA